MDEENAEENLRYELNDMIYSINRGFEILTERKAIDADLSKRLWIDATKVQLPYLYFLPDVSKVRRYVSFFVSFFLLFD